jgi:putative transposase
MTDVPVSAEAVEEVKPSGLKTDALDDQPISQLVDRAKADGAKLTGEGGLQHAGTGCACGGFGTGHR